MIRSPLMIDEQIDDMRRRWPCMRARSIDRSKECVDWVGPVRPQFAAYRLEIQYSVWDDPKVRVLSPALMLQPGNDEGALPHVYGPLDDPKLCLWDPDAHEWGPHLRVSETLVPWSLKWLVCYEAWVMTGRWVGGGRHASSLPLNLSGLAT